MGVGAGMTDTGIRIRVIKLENPWKGMTDGVSRGIHFHRTP